MKNKKLSSSEIKNRKILKEIKPLVYDKVMKFEEKYAKGESIAIIQLHYNYMCNFKCTHCSISTLKNKENKRILNIDAVRKLAKEADALGIAHIDITGGEPTLFSDMDELVEAINPEKFYIQSDTNGWNMTEERAKHLKSIGVDKIQLSLDSLDAEEHDSFRNKKGSHERALQSIDNIKNAGLKMHLSTVVTHSRAKSDEFIQFLEFAKSKDVGVSICFPKPVGEWAGQYSELIQEDDIKYLDSLKDEYNVFNHLTPVYGMNIGCIAVKRMVSVTAYGDVLPCPWMYFSLGNIFEESFEDILKRGMKYFGKHQEKCLISNDINFIKKYVSKTYNKKVPIRIEEIMPEGTYII